MERMVFDMKIIKQELEFEKYLNCKYLTFLKKFKVGALWSKS